MGEFEQRMGAVSLDEPHYERITFGKEMKRQFLFQPGWKNFNHGSYGALPRAIRDKQRQYQDECEGAPDPFIRYKYKDLSDKSREAVANLLNVPTDTVVFVPNATTGVNTVLRNLVWNEDGKDEVLFFSTVYGACGLTVEYVSEVNHGRVVSRNIPLVYPVEDLDLLRLFEEAIVTSQSEGKRPRVALFDTITSMPGLRVPFEKLISICKKENIYSLVDGAHGIGHISLDLSALDPDFFVSNCHKWLYVPRGCAVFYVPERNQALMRSSLPTSHWFIPRGPGHVNPLPPSSKSNFIIQFESMGTIDLSNYLSVAEAIKWRKEACGGEQAIMDYCHNLSRQGGEIIAKDLGTEVLNNSTNTLTACKLANVLLPITIGEAEKIPGSVYVKEDHKMQAYEWMHKTLMEDYGTYIAIFFMNGKWWARISAQIYLDMEDFEWAGRTLKELCVRVGNEEYLDSGK